MSAMKQTETVKSCYVRLNRNIFDSVGTTKINNFPMVERKISENFHRGKNLGVVTASSKASDGHDQKLRKKEKVEYFDERQSSCSETSDSEWSEDDSSLTDGETTEEKVGKRKNRKLSKTEELKKRACLICKKTFSSHTSYLVHKRSHQPKQYKCILCKSTQKDRESFVRHMKSYHPEVEPFLCDYRRCQKSFKTQNLLNLHSKVHLRYMCRFCKQLFAKKENMRKHVIKFH